MLHHSEPYDKEKDCLPPYSPVIQEIIAIIESDYEACDEVRGHLEKFLYLVITEVDNAILLSDTSPKMILHEPYRTVRNNVLEVFYGQGDDK